MLNVILPLTLLGQQPLGKPFEALLKPAGVVQFKLNDESHHAKGSFSLENQTAGSPITRLSVNVTPVSPAGFDGRHAFDEWKGKPNAAGVSNNAGVGDWRKPHRTPSGSPLGFDLYFSSGAGSVRAGASSKYGSVTTFIQSRGVSKSRNVVWAGGQAKRDQLAERLVRWTLAQMVGDSLSTAPIRSVNGIRVRRFSARSVGSFMVASDWAASQKVRPTIDLTEGRFTVPTAKGELTLILGSDRAKLNGKWVPLEEVLPSRGTDILIPESLVRLVEK